MKIPNSHNIYREREGEGEGEGEGELNELFHFYGIFGYLKGVGA